MKKLMPLAASIALILMASLFATAGTMTWFNDTETSYGNIATAGTLDLKVNDEDNPITVHVDLSDMAPGDGWDGGVGGSIRYCWTLKNVGSITGQPWVEIGSMTNKEHGLEEPEKGAPGENNGQPGELGDYLKVRWGRVGSGCYITMTMSGYPGFHTLNSIGGKTIGTSGSDFSGYPFAPLAQDESVDFVIYVTLPPDTGNCVQGDSVEFDITFHLDQIQP